MPKWLFVMVLLVQTHFAASYLVPLDDTAKDAFAGFLRWAWPWEIGNRGLLGEITATQAPIIGLFIALTAATAFLLAALGVAGIWVPFSWSRSLVVIGSTALTILMVGFFGPTKVLPIALSLFVLWGVVTGWASTAWSIPAGG